MFNNTAMPRATDFIQKNMAGIIVIADSIHSSITSFALPFITSNPTFMCILGVGCLAYNIAHIWIAEKNLKNNEQKLGDEELTLMKYTLNGNNHKVPQSSDYVVIDDEVYINEQGGAIIGDLDIGGFKIKDKGCGIIATYNLLRRLKKLIKLSRLIYYYEMKNLIFVAAGAWPTHIAELLTSLGISFSISYREEDSKNYSDERCKEYIILYFTSNSGVNAHYTFVTRIDEYYHDYTNDIPGYGNQYYEVNGSPTPKNSVYNILGSKKLITIIKINEGENRG